MEAPSTSNLLAFLAGCLLLFLTVGATPVRYCDKQGDYPVKVNGVDIHPNPVVRGDPATFTISAVSEGAITGGELIIDVKYFGIHVHRETRQLCDDTTCPVSSGDFVISHDEILPLITPPGSYTLTMKMLGEGRKELTCFSFDFKIRIGSPVVDT